MKVISFVLLSATLSLASAAGGIVKIEGVEEPIDFITFDSELNIYAVRHVSPNMTYFSSTIYKINFEREILWTLDLDSYIVKISINNQNDAFVFTALPDEEIIGRTTVNLIRAGSSIMEELDTVTYPVYDFIDKEGNLFYSSVDGGVKIIRPNENIPVMITGTENFQIFYIYKSTMMDDKDGNVYLGGCVNGPSDPSYNNCLNTTAEAQIIRITAEEIQKVNPKAEIVNNILQDPKSEFVMQILTTGNDVIITTATLEENSIGTIWVLRNNTANVLLLEEGLHIGEAAKDKIIFHSSSELEDNDRCKIFYLTSNLELMPITNLQDIDGSCLSMIFQVDQIGNFFIGSHSVINTSTVEFLKHGESQTVGIRFKDEINWVQSMAIDGNGYLWLLDAWGTLFYVPKGTVEGEKIFDSTGLNLHELKRNEFSNEIFAYGNGHGIGLYVIVPY